MTLAEIANVLNIVGLVTASGVCVRLMLRQTREMMALEAENEAYARTVVRAVLRGRGPAR